MSKMIFEFSGEMRFIYDDDLLEVAQEVGDLEIKRASHVEPDPHTKSGWLADMAPVGGPVLGPYPTRKAALEAEREWLVLGNVPIPR